MSEHKATITWKRETTDFTYRTYNRAHTWTFAGGVQVPASAAVQYLGQAERVNPEEAFVASLSSCHMLTFLAIAAKKRFVVESYVDEAVGHLEKNAAGKLAVTRVELHPRPVFTGTQPTEAQLRELHELAHAECFIANSVTTEVTVA